MNNIRSSIFSINYYCLLLLLLLLFIFINRKFYIFLDVKLTIRVLLLVLSLSWPNIDIIEYICLGICTGISFSQRYVSWIASSNNIKSMPLDRRRGLL